MSDESKKRPAELPWNDNDEAARFITAWQTSSSVNEVAARLGIPAAEAESEATKYRKYGINLRQLARTGDGPLLARAKAITRMMSEQERKELFGGFSEFCRHCGGGLPCHCSRDD